MESHHLVILCLITFFNVLTSSLASSPCGNGWTPFKDEECVKLIETSGTQTKEDADVICMSLSDGENNENVVKLLNIKTKEKQKFVQELVFSKHSTFDNVWLGLELGNDSAFRWNDGTELFFTNWANQKNSEDERHCVQMESGEGAYETGLWVRSNCKKRNAVVCEKSQTWSVTKLQNMLLKLKLETERNKKEAADELAAVKQEIKNNPVPVGFVYVQLGTEPAPTAFWPQVTWADVSSSYGNLFFRVKGSKTASVNQIQEESVPRFINVERREIGDNGGHTASTISIPSNGQWSNWVWTGDGYGNSDVFLRFLVSNNEVRPRNQAVTIWRRTA